MQLVIRRSRRESWYAFTINARMVIDREEEDLLAKYRLKQVILTEGNFWRDVRKALLIAIPLTAALYFILAIFSTALRLENVLTGFGTFLGFFVVLYAVYDQIREEVRVNDLLTGWDFKARSFVGLLLKEQMIRKASAVFALVVEQSKTWHEPEVIELEPQPLPTVLEGYREAA